MRRTCVVFFFGIGAFCWAQAGTQVPAPAPSSSPDNAIKSMAIPQKSSPGKPSADAIAESVEAGDDLPAYKLEFKEQEKPIAGVAASPLIQAPVRCASDGTSYFNMIDVPSSKDQPFDPFKQTVYAVSEKGSHSFSVKSLSDLDNVRFVAMDADDSTAVFLVNGIRKDEESDSSSKSKVNVKPKSYIAFFDLDGNYKKSVEVGVQYYPSDIALLTSGEFVIFGYDEVNSVVRISLLDSDGAFIRPITFSGDLVGDPAFQEAESGTGLERARAVVRSGIGSWRFAHARGKVLLYEPDSKAPVLEIGPNGAKREVPISLPKGYFLDAFLPSADRWIARFQEDGPNKPSRSFAGTYSNKMALYELNSADGSLRYRIDLGDEVQFNPYCIVCEQDGRFLAYKTDKDAKLILLNADVAR